MMCLAFVFILSLVCSTRLVAGSYLDVPRIHFAGQFRADVNTRNNDPCNFDINNNLTVHDEWNYRGTNEWELVDTKVTAVIGSDGVKISNSPLVGAKIFSNRNRPFAKIVDIDVDFQVSALYGMEFGMESSSGEELFNGKWSTSAIVHDMWQKVKCSKEVDGSSLYGAQSTTQITDIVWSQSTAIKSLKNIADSALGKLSVSITLDAYKVDVFVMGSVYGTIGIAKSGEPLNLGGERKMYPEHPGKLNFDKTHPCHEKDSQKDLFWSYGVPFKIDSSRNVLVADLGNALPKQDNGNPLDIGSLYFGVLINGAVQPFGESISYLNPTDTLWKHSGILEVPVDDVSSSLANNQLVVFIDTTVNGGSGYPVKGTFSSTLKHHTVPLLLLESEYFIRPMNYYIDRLEYSNGDDSVRSSTDFTLYVTRYGTPAGDTAVTVTHSINKAGQAVLPEGAVAPTVTTKNTDSNGHVTFTFSVNQAIPTARQYEKDPCKKEEEEEEDEKEMVEQRKKFGKFLPYRRKIKLIVEFMTALKQRTAAASTVTTLPIDGQLYNFHYCVGSECTLPEDQGFYMYRGLLSILAFSTVNYQTPYTWVHDVKPIFEQVHHLHYIMRTILDLSNYTEVVLPHNIELLKKSFSHPITDPNYMPTTRDLSPTKLKMILAWLDNPLYDKDKKKKTADDEAPVCDTSSLSLKMRKQNFMHFRPPRCLLKNIAFNSDPHDDDHFFKHIVKHPKFSRLEHHAKKPPRHLFGYGDKAELKKLLEKYNNVPTCDLDKLKAQLQNAVQLEFSTIPLYLTSMYSIVENCNTESYQAIRDIVMQEMLHMAQAANILIAVGGKVVIDDPDFVPSYPATDGLPGGVLPELDVFLEKFNLRHVYDTLMAIETPMLTSVARPEPEFTLYTIGQFYKEILLCMNALGNDIFDSSTVSKQVTWPWDEPDSVGKLYTIDGIQSARDAIKHIIEQGEGADALTPEQVSTGQYGHFYRFEEIMCQRKLVHTAEGGYAYIGDKIEFNAAGVYPMRENPSSDTIVKDSDCYTEARAFHHTYRSFLRVLQEAFSGEPSKIQRSVELMEALQVHAKKCMWTPYGSANTCGPVWDYHWD